MDFLIPPTDDRSGYPYAIFMLLVTIVLAFYVVYFLIKANRKVEEQERMEEKEGMSSQEQMTENSSYLSEQGDLRERDPTQKNDDHQQTDNQGSPNPQLEGDQVPKSKDQ